ncbi:MAG: [Oscillospiraceae bacterium]|nr:[FeFe] hydrogenase H-cluster maturation GTPase HydF [Oscillospiraceae bacterium]
MGLQDTVSAERTHIGFFGARNAGKSSLANAVTGQNLSVVSDVAGTTTDPVKKAMELLPLGPVVIIDTPGLDDEGELGELRMKKARETLARVDIAVLTIDALRGFRAQDEKLKALFQERGLPYLIAYNKADLLSDRPPLPENALYVSAVTGENVAELKERIGAFAGSRTPPRRLLDGLVSPGDFVVLVIPVDESAPKGRLILPQQQTMRELLDLRCSFVACQDTELKATLSALRITPKLVITDSQAFGRVSEIAPDEIPLTSFSILFARYRGNLNQLAQGAAKLSQLRDGDNVLISEGCTHHRQCQDIGTVKLPRWIERCSGAKPRFSFTSGGDFPENLSQYALVVHCGGCTLNEKEMRRRLQAAADAEVPVVNYGMAIAQMRGILARSLRPFPDAERLLN